MSWKNVRSGDNTWDNDNSNVNAIKIPIHLFTEKSGLQRPFSILPPYGTIWLVFSFFSSSSRKNVRKKKRHANKMKVSRKKGD